jgi:AraC-like DNA-binding protein
MGIIEMMTQIRLEEARRALLMFNQKEKNHALTVRDVALGYGFKHQGRFSRRYFTSFGELPSQTLDRSQEL